MGQESVGPTVRMIWTGGLGTLWAIGYFGLAGRPMRAPVDLATHFDTLLPFVGWTVWPYLFGILFAFAPAVVIRCRHLFRRVAYAYATALVAAVSCYILYPTASPSLRPDLSLQGADALTRQAVLWLYAVDPERNLFPSLHVSLTAVSALSLWKARGDFSAWAAGIVTLVAISVCTVKQHVVADVAGGLVLAFLVYVFFLRSYRASTVTVE